MIDGVQLDPSQMAAASIPPEGRQIVIAGPGAGKSEVVGALARNLVDEGVPPEAILVVSFSRAAGDVVRRRTADITERGEIVDVATLDSLASRVIDELGDEESAFAGYDAAIDLATRLLEHEDAPFFEDIDHVIVDEVQDVVGVRIRFVETLLARAIREDAGFTLLGDPLQSIYGFADRRSSGSTEELLARINARFSPTARHLTGEYRARSDDARAVGRSRDELLRMGGEQRLRRVNSLLAGLSPLGDLDSEVAEDISGWRGSTALLCDTNIRTALVIDELGSIGILAEPAEPNANPSPAVWLTRVFDDPAQTTMSKEEFVSKCEALGVTEPAEVWAASVIATNSRRGLDRRRLAAVLASRRIPFELARVPVSRLLASTVHRAKGLEFDNVILVDPDKWAHEKSDPVDEAHRLFVAASRAHNRLTIVRGPETKNWRKGRGPEGRWERRLFPKAKPDATLLTPVDMLPTEPRGEAPLFDLPSPAPEVLWRRTDDGHTDADGESVPSWDAVVGARVVATTGPGFGAYMTRRRDVDRLELRGGRVLGWETRIVPDSKSTGYEFRRMPRIGGPIVFERS